MAAFIADALSLGVHWVYDTSDIDKKYGRLDRMVKPELVPYHSSRQKGGFTHYGDQMLVLLESISQNAGFDVTSFSKQWQKLFLSYNGYMDHATKETMENIKSGEKPGASGSLSLDLGGASRISPLALFYADDINAFVDAARTQTAMTHNNSLVIESAELFARTSAQILKGATPLNALEKSLEKMPDAQEIQQMVASGIKSRSEDTRKTIKRFGQMCSVQAALPSTVHLIVKYDGSLKDALIENIMAGGDSSARGMLAGFILGCYQGLAGIPVSWTKDMAAYEKITGLVQTVK